MVIVLVIVSFFADYFYYYLDIVMETLFNCIYSSLKEIFLDLVII